MYKTGLLREYGPWLISTTKYMYDSGSFLNPWAWVSLYFNDIIVYV